MSNAPIRIGLTKCQREMLEGIEAYIAQHNQPPSYREIANMFGFKSTGRVTEVLRALQERGWITFIPGRARSITVMEKVSPRTGGYDLGLALDAKLRRFCADTNQRPEDVVADAVALLLDQEEGQVAA
ncbi:MULTISPECIES: LexA family protein [unclassified Bradyrhizobium]|uniref:LexA family protein n=1 Tax=unclassified Bradyrhizobium TaxID=2631580 RepID=UPI00211F26B0|nr:MULTISPECIES: hypothetical protein [unclassified Bradyrhizobium]MDD1534591.1 hypothetical protein [Bradyrhizobium sp. WBOS8]MDD1581455.1 hypothetical protein [Bradyrhizobium sp. WBOS4]UUO49741.1 hypothetical protein DCM78_24215 [Bradyrhizobium sp. WBOS04]UUO58507.1 hypothetical protein DCM80_04495 [Bradyrhizobium sp. WBOS08]